MNRGKVLVVVSVMLTVVIALAVFVHSARAMTLQGSNRRTVFDGVYTNEQATRGEAGQYFDRETITASQSLQWKWSPPLALLSEPEDGKRNLEPATDVSTDIQIGRITKCDREL